MLYKLNQKEVGRGERKGGGEEVEEEGEGEKEGEGYVQTQPSRKNLITIQVSAISSGVNNL